MKRQTVLISIALVLTAAAAFAAQSGTFRIHAPDVPAPVVSRLRADLVRAEARIDKQLGPFPDTVSVHVHASRAAFSTALRDEWGIPSTECWMVGAAGDHVLHLLSPAVWADQACEHDAEDPAHVRGIITHELVHAYHGQVNPSDDLGLLEDIGWFTEGLATYVSGQLERDHDGRAAEAIRAGQAPTRLADAWSGPYRYGVAGSLVAFIDDEWGRPTLRRLLTATSQADILALLDTSEPELLDRWQRWVLSRRPADGRAGPSS